jgi:hypothetical protein
VKSRRDAGDSKPGGSETRPYRFNTKSKRKSTSNGDSDSASDGNSNGAHLKVAATNSEAKERTLLG